MKAGTVTASCLLLGLMAVTGDVGAASLQRLSHVTAPYLGQTPPDSNPQPLGPGVLPTDAIEHCFPAFSPMGGEVYWMRIVFRDDKAYGVIWYMEESDGQWTRPQIAPFSGIYDDHAPVFSADGNTLYFSSARPGNASEGKNLWYVNRTDTGWTTPRHLGSPPNSRAGASQATFTREGTVYFIGRFEGTQWGTAIYRSRRVNGSYTAPEVLPPPIRTQHADVYPFIAPDESYLIFGSSRPGGHSDETDLYISFRNPEDEWSDPILLDESINNGFTVSFSCVTHDGRYLIFNRFDADGTDKFFWVDAGILESYRSRARWPGGSGEGK